MQKTRPLSYCIGLVMVVLFVYGLIRYPDLPIRECPSGYCGRQGQPHTAAEYNAFSIWQTTLFIVWPVGMLIMLLLQRGKPKRPGADDPDADRWLHVCAPLGAPAMR